MLAKQHGNPCSQSRGVCSHFSACTLLSKVAPGLPPATHRHLLQGLEWPPTVLSRTCAADPILQGPALLGRAALTSMLKGIYLYMPPAGNDFPQLIGCHGRQHSVPLSRSTASASLLVLVCIQCTACHSCHAVQNLGRGIYTAVVAQLPWQLGLVGPSQVSIKQGTVSGQRCMQQPPQLTLQHKELKALVLDLLDLQGARQGRAEGEGRLSSVRGWQWLASMH